MTACAAISASVVGPALARLANPGVDSTVHPVAPEILRSPGSMVCARVLLAEDNPVNRELTRMMLERLGCQVDVAEEGEAAVGLIRQRRYDIVLMDGEMPGVDGLEATRRIRDFESAGGGRRTPVIAVTAHALTEDRERYLGAGLDDYLSKPFTLAQLEAVLRRWVPEGQTQERLGQ